MPIGWIDYSKTDRNKVLNVLSLLSEQGTLDELGIAPIRDGFSNLFFPGTSTIQTRAKYFLIVPYIFRDLELKKYVDATKMQNDASAMEQGVAEALIENENDLTGIIGWRSLLGGLWVKRPPSEIYWAGLRKYNIFCGGDLTLSEYIRICCRLNKSKSSLEKLGNKNDNDELDHDDNDANSINYYQFWNIPHHKNDWIDNISLDLTKEEGQFLKKQIINTCPNTLIEYILSNNKVDLMGAKSFPDLYSLVHTLPKEYQKDYHMAYDFSEFVFILRIVFNMLASDNKNREAKEYWKRYKRSLNQIARIDIDKVFERLGLFGHLQLRRFLLDSQSYMKKGDLDGLKRIVREREISLKGESRAKTAHPGEFDPNEWFCGYDLDYRFSNARVIIADIFKSEGLC